VSAGELMEQGIRAYTRGQLGEAERCWRDVLAVDPGNARALSYLELLVGKLVQNAASAPGSASPVPLPAPSREPAGAERNDPGLGLGAVPLPPPLPPAWLRGPVTLPPTPRSFFTAEGSPRPNSRVEAQAAGRDHTTLSDYVPSPWDQGPVAEPAVVLGEGGGLDLESVAEQSDLRSLVPEAAERQGDGALEKSRNEVEVWLDGARELFALGDFSGSLEMIEKILKRDPSHAEARQYLQQNEVTLIAMYESKLGPVDAFPRLAIKPEEVMWLNLDHRAGFLLAQIDGTVRYEDLFALSGLPRLDTARILATLLQEGVITS
jgi:tetratricopeptide (TPR) repeat protein